MERCLGDVGSGGEESEVEELGVRVLLAGHYSR